jgi:tetratricopeptide (TPR) repeat protein
VHRARGEWGPLVAVLNHIALRMDPDAWVTYQRLAANVHQERYQAAASVAKDALKRFPAHRRTIQLDLAIVQFLAGEPAEAQEGVRRVLGTDPYDCDAGFSLSLMGLASGEVPTRVPACRQDALPPIALAAWSDLAALHGRKPEVARRAARRLLEASLDDHAGWRDAAAGRCAEILEFAPECFLARCLVPVLWERAGRRDKALAASRDLQDRRPNFARDQLTLADLLLLDGKAEHAGVLYRQYARTGTGDFDALVKGALLSAASGDSAAAVAAWRDLLAGGPDRALAYNNLAWALATQSPPDLAEALNAAHAALKLAPQEPAVLDTAGWVHFLAGEPEEASRLLEQAARAVPYRALYQYHLGVAYARRRLTAKAREALAKAIELDPDAPFLERASQAIADLE